MKILFKLYVQRRRVDLWLDQTVVELLALRLQACRETSHCHFAMQRWLGIAVRQQFCQCHADDTVIRQWVLALIKNTLL